VPPAPVLARTGERHALRAEPAPPAPARAMGGGKKRS
jgi:hypothetical protein